MSYRIFMGDFKWAARTREITPGNGKTVIVDGISVTLFNVDGSFHAIQDPCVNPDGNPQEIGLPQRVSSCMWHGWEYDVRTGESLTAPGTYARTFEVKVEGELVFLRMPRGYCIRSLSGPRRPLNAAVQAYAIGSR